MNKIISFFTKAPFIFWAIGIVLVGYFGNFLFSDFKLGIAGNYSLGFSQAGASSGITVNQGKIYSYAPTSCPNFPFTNSQYANLPSTNIKVSDVGKIIKVKKGQIQVNHFITAKTRKYPIKYPLLISPSATTSTFSVSGSNWNDLTTCANGEPDQWFVGGSGEITSQDQIVLVNSGLTPATISINLFGHHSNSLQITRTIAANTQSTFGIAGLLPGEVSPAIEILTLSGRVTPYLLDVRSKGLSSLGGGLVPVSQSPDTTQVIPGVVSNLKIIGKNNASEQLFLRLLVPGNIDATASVKVISNDGSFVPLGLDQINISHQKTIDLPLTNFYAPNPVAIVISSDQPLVAVAGQFFSNGLTWFGSAPTISNLQLSLNNFQPTLTLINPKNNPGVTKVTVVYSGNGGKAEKTGIQILSLNDFLTWKAPFPINSILIQPSNQNIYGAFSFISSNGINRSLVLRPGAEVFSISAPTPDAKVLHRS